MNYKDEKGLGNSVLSAEKAGVLSEKITGKDAEKMVKAALGSNVFEREEGSVKKDNPGGAKGETAKVVRKWEDQPKEVKENIAGGLEEKTKKKRKAEKKKRKKTGAEINKKKEKMEKEKAEVVDGAFDKEIKKEVLNEARDKFARVYLIKKQQYMEAEKKLGKKGTKEGFEKDRGTEYEEAKKKYFKALESRREEMLKEAVEKFEKMGLSGEERDEKIEKMLLEIIEDEDNKLRAKKAELDLELKGKENKAKEKVLQEKDFELSRKAAEITLARIDNYQNLWAETEQEGDKKFIEKTRKAWKEFVVHGVMGIDKKTSERVLLNYTDLDGKCSLDLLKLAGINTKNVEYVESGKFTPGKINLDTGDRHGLVVEDEGRTVFMDHHGEKSGQDTSATKVVYETLVSLELLKKEDHLDKLVEFVTQVDNRTYLDGDKHFEHSWQTILGLQRFILPKYLLTFFQAGRNPTEILSSSDLKKFGLVNRSKEQKRAVESSLAELQKMELAGLIIPSERYGKIAVDIDKKVQAGSDAAKAYGCGGYIIWNPKEISFFINTKNDLGDSFSQGKKVRDKMWIKPRNDKTPLNITLKEILNQMTDGQLRPEDKLKEFLEKEVSENVDVWIKELSEDKTEQEKIASLLEKILELAGKVDVYEGRGEGALRRIAVNQTIKSYKAARDSQQ